MRKFWLGLIGLMALAPLLWARYIPASYGLDEQAKAADLIVILQPVSSTTTRDPYPNEALRKLHGFVGVNTVFTVAAVVKGRAPRSEQLTVLHFRLPRAGETAGSNKSKGGEEPVRVIVNGPHLAEFPMPKQGATQWLAFLKKRPDGRYEPMVNQFDSAESFRRLEHR